MGLFDGLFGGRLTKFDLIRDLLKTRLRNDPMALCAGVDADAVDAEPDMVMIGTPEAAITTIVESYLVMKRHGVSDGKVLELIEAHRSMVGSTQMPSPLTLRSYIRYRVSLEHSDSAPVSDESMDFSIGEAEKFFGGAG